MVFKKCLKCGALVKVIKDCTCDNCGIRCCDEEMKELKANSVDAVFEKHVPVYEVKDNNLVVTVNHVMEEDHYIEWIIVKTEDGHVCKKFKPGDTPTVTVPYTKATLYAYCNKHGLWKTEVE